MDISPQKSSQYSYIKYALQNIDEITTYFNIPVGNSKREIIEYLQSEDFDVVKKMKLYDEFERQVTEKIKTNQIQYITHGSEGVIYKTIINDGGKNKEIIVLKKRFDNTVDHEYNLHRKAAMYNNGKENNAYIPEIFGKIERNGELYLAMEYIDGKTLYTLMLENMIETFHRKTQGKSHELDGVFKNYISNHQCNLENDTEAESAAFTIIDALNRLSPETLLIYQTGFSKNTTHKERVDTLTTLFNKMQISLFSEQEKSEINTAISNSLNTLHKRGIYHRDLGENPRNLMIVEGKLPVIIDFGQGIMNKEFSSQKHFGKGEGPYSDPSTNGLENSGYAPDEYITRYIDRCTYTVSQKEDISSEYERKNLTNTCYEYRKHNLSQLKIQFGWKITEMPIVVNKTTLNRNFLEYIEESIIVGGTQKPWQQYGGVRLPLEWDRSKKTIISNVYAEEKIIKSIASYPKEYYEKTMEQIRTLIKTSASPKKTKYYEYILAVMEYCKQGFQEEKQK